MAVRDFECSLSGPSCGWGSLTVTAGPCLCGHSDKRPALLRRPVQSHQSQPPGPPPWRQLSLGGPQGLGGGSGDTHVRGVPRPTSGGDDNVLGRKQSLGRKRGSRGHPGTSRRLHCALVAATALWRRPRGSPETGLSTSRRASQFTQRPRGEDLQNPTRPCWAGPPEPRAASSARFLRHRVLDQPGPRRDVLSIPAARIAGDSAEAV